MAEHDVVFEDLHGVKEDQTVTVDLDAGTKDDGISRAPTDQVAGDDGGNNDGVEFDDLRSAQALSQADDDDTASKAGEDDGGYSKKVKARIQRATRGEKKAKQEASYWKSQAETLAKETHDREKRTLERSIEQADLAIKQAESDLESAFEDGESKDQVRMTSKLTDLKADKLIAQSTLDNLAPDGNVQPFDAKVTTVPDEDQSMADKWKAERSDWYGAKGFDRQTRLANRIDREVYNDGYELETEEYFEELDRRIKAKQPDLYDDDVDDNANDDPGDKEHKRPARSPVAGVGHQDSRSKASSSRVQLTEADFANMRRFNLDTNNPEVLKEYARNKQESEAAEEGRS